MRGWLTGTGVLLLCGTMPSPAQEPVAAAVQSYLRDAVHRHLSAILTDPVSFGDVAFNPPRGLTIRDVAATRPSRAEPGATVEILRVARIDVELTDPPLPGLPLTCRSVRIEGARLTPPVPEEGEPEDDAAPTLDVGPLQTLGRAGPALRNLLRPGILKGPPWVPPGLRRIEWVDARLAPRWEFTDLPMEPLTIVAKADRDDEGVIRGSIKVRSDEETLLEANARLKCDSEVSGDFDVDLTLQALKHGLMKVRTGDEPLLKAEVRVDSDSDNFGDFDIRLTVQSMNNDAISLRGSIRKMPAEPAPTKSLPEKPR